MYRRPLNPDVPLSATEIARRTEIPVPTTHRIVADLLRLGLLERDDQRLLRVGYRLWELATRSSSALSIRDLALPFMEELHSVVRQHTQLSILDGYDVLIVEKLTSRRSSGTNVAPPGSRCLRTVRAPGLVLAAFGESSARENLLLGGRLTKFTDATVCSTGMNCAICWPRLGAWGLGCCTWLDPFRHRRPSGPCDGPKRPSGGGTVRNRTAETSDDTLRRSPALITTALMTLEPLDPGKH